MAKYYKGGPNKAKWKKPSLKAEAFGKAFQTAVTKPRYGIAVFNKATANMTVERLRSWEEKTVVGTAQQEVIWDVMQNGTKHLLGKALAGTGKTFTAMEGVTRMTKADEVECTTSHSMMYTVLKEFYPGVRTNQYKVHDLVNEKLGIRKDEYVSEAVLNTRNNVVTMVGLYKNTMLEPTSENFFKLCDRFTIDINGSEEEVYELSRDCLKLSNEDLGHVDFDDMIYLPVLLGLEPKRKFKFLIVDEAQDYNVAQRLGAMMCAERIMAIGDEHQSIYAFRGADAMSMPNFLKGLEEKGGVDVLPLTMTRRCPKKVVESVLEYVPEFEAMPDAKEGSVEWMDREDCRKEYRKGDMILCRTNAPLCSEAYSMLGAGKPCRIQGRDFGKSLVNFIRKMKPQGVVDLMEKLEKYRGNELARLKAKAKYRPVDNLVQAVNDKVGCINVFCQGASTVEDVTSKITMLFTEMDVKDRQSFTLLSSVHRAKGDEAERVFILERDTIPGNRAKTEEAKQQEVNIVYTAHTRSMNELVLVPSGNAKDRDEL